MSLHLQAYRDHLEMGHPAEEGTVMITELLPEMTKKTGTHHAH